MALNNSSREGARVLWVVIHTAEGARTAANLKKYFEKSTNSSSHAIADDSVLMDNLVPYNRASWTLRSGNSRSDNLELCGFAAWSREEWLKNHQGMLNHAAAWIRSRCLARGIPLRKLTAQQVANNEAGVIGHIEYTNGKKDGSHWDPGPGFPWDVVMSRAANGTTPEETEVNSEVAIINHSVQPLSHHQTISIPWETSSGSALTKRSWLHLSSGWGDTEFKVYFLHDSGIRQEAIHGPEVVAENAVWKIAVPSYTVGVQIEYRLDPEAAPHPMGLTTAGISLFGDLN